MRTIVLASRKGGAGKTTLATHLGIAAERAGAGRVAFLDADPMGGLAAWWNERAAATPELGAIGDGGLPAAVETLRRSGVDLLVIDTPPASSASVLSAIALADLVVVPVIPSPNDLRAIGETLEMIEQADRPMLFAINNASVTGRLTLQAVGILNQFGQIAAIDGQCAIVQSRQDFRSSMGSGRTVSETHPKSKSTAEIAALWRCIDAQLERGKRRGSRT